MIQCFTDLQHLVVSQSNWIFEMLPNAHISKYLSTTYARPHVIFNF